MHKKAIKLTLTAQKAILKFFLACYLVCFLIGFIQKAAAVRKIENVRRSILKDLKLVRLDQQDLALVYYDGKRALYTYDLQTDSVVPGLYAILDKKNGSAASILENLPFNKEIALAFLGGTATAGFTIKYILENEYFDDSRSMVEYLAVIMAFSGGIFGGYFLGSEAGELVSPGTGSSKIVDMLEKKQTWRELELLYCQNAITHIIFLSQGIENLEMRDSITTLAQKYYPLEISANSPSKIERAANLLQFVSGATHSPISTSLKEKMTWVSWVKVVVTVVSLFLFSLGVYFYIDIIKLEKK